MRNSLLALFMLSSLAVCGVCAALAQEVGATAAGSGTVEAPKAKSIDPIVPPVRRVAPVTPPPSKDIKGVKLNPKAKPAAQGATCNAARKGQKGSCPPPGAVAKKAGKSVPAAKIVAEPAGKSAQAGKPKTGKPENKKVDATKP